MEAKQPQKKKIPQKPARDVNKAAAVPEEEALSASQRANLDATAKTKKKKEKKEKKPTPAPA